MGFDRGSIGCRIYTYPRALPGDVVKRFAENAAPPLDTLGPAEVRGWVSWRHLMDRVITDENAHYAGYLRLNLVCAERKIPASLLRAECRMEELARLAASGSVFLNRTTRAEIRAEVTERLLPRMPPQLRGAEFVADERARVLYSAALSTRQADAFAAHFQHTTGVPLVPCVPATLALAGRRGDVRDWPPASFSAEAPDATVSAEAGHDFLTWLWFVTEARDGTVSVPDLGDAGVGLEGPLTFYMEGEGAHEIVLRKGQPLASLEANACLRGGKKLRQALVHLTLGDRAWSFTLGAEEFVVRGLRLPEQERLDDVSRFQDRVRLLDTFRQILAGLFDVFAAERTDRNRWAKTRRDIHAWVAGRPGVR